MAKNKMTVDFSGFEQMKKKLDRLGGEATKNAINDALKATQQLIAEQASAAISPHTFTGQTKSSIITSDPVEWTGDTASVAVGFDIERGGLPSILLMHGTKLHGQPHISPDRNLYNAVYGAQTRKKVMEIQKQAFEKVLGGLIENES